MARRMRRGRKRPLMVTKGQKLEILAAGSRGKYLRKRFTTALIKGTSSTSSMSGATSIGFAVNRGDSACFISGLVRGIACGQTLQGTGNVPGAGLPVLWIVSKYKYQEQTSNNLPAASTQAHATLNAWTGREKRDNVSILGHKLLMCPSTPPEGTVPIAFEHKLKETKVEPGEIVRFFHLFLDGGLNDKNTIRISTFQWWTTYSTGEANLTPQTEANSTFAVSIDPIDAWYNPGEGQT